MEKAGPQPDRAATAAGGRQPRSSGGLQLELRRLFQIAAPHVALRQSLARIGPHFGATYVALHGSLASEPLSEEWYDDGQELGDELREAVTTAMFETLAGGVARCLRLAGRGTGTDGSIVAVAPMFDEELTAAGAAALIVPGTDRERAVSLLSTFENLVGLLAVLATNEQDIERRIEASAQKAGQLVDAAAGSAAAASARPDEDPWRIGWDLVGHIQTAHGVDEVSLGIVRADKQQVDVKVISGMDVVRQSNPGVRRIRAAMEEGLDRGEITLWPGRDAGAIEDLEEASGDPRLHRQWSDACGGDPVATIPVPCGRRIVAVVAIRSSSVQRLRRARLSAIEAELRTWGPLLPLVTRAGRDIVRHAAEVARARAERVVGQGLRRGLIFGGFGLALLAFGFLARVDDVLTVPARLVPGHVRVISAPRTASLTEVLVNPGDWVEAGQLMARFDLREDRLEAVELRARIDVLRVDADVARAEGDLGKLKVTEARLAAAVGELAVLDERLRGADVRSPVAGLVLAAETGDRLSERVGDLLTSGDTLYRVSAGGRIRAELLVPDRMMPSLVTLDDATVRFYPHADPTLTVDLGGCSVPTAATPVDGRSTFILRADAPKTAGLRPGMEGAAKVRLGTISVVESWTRPVVRWLRRLVWL